MQVYIIIYVYKVNITAISIAEVNYIVSPLTIIWYNHGVGAGWWGC